MLNCNCEISSNSDDVIVGNKHNAIVFYSGNEVVRLVLLTRETDVMACLGVALSQLHEGITLKDLFNQKNIECEVLDLKQEPKLNKHNGKRGMDIGSCDRMSLLHCMLNGDYTESETGYGNYNSLEYDFNRDIEIVYSLKTDNEQFEIHHQGAFVTKEKDRAIIIQTDGNIMLDELNISGDIDLV